MKGKRYRTETKIGLLREAESSDKTVQDVCRERKISEQIFYRWKRELGMLELNQAKQLKELQRENTRLKRMMAYEMLGKELLKETLEKSCKPRTQATDGTKACLGGALHGRSGLLAFWAAPEHLCV